MDISGLYVTLLSMFVAIGVGYFARRCGLVEQHFVDGLSKLILFILQSALTVGSVLNVEHLLSNQEVLLLSVIALGCYAFLLAFAVAVPFLFRQREKSAANVYRYMMVFSNVGFMGYPLVKSLYGEGAMFHVTIFVLVFNLVVNSVGAYYMSGDKKHIKLSTEILKKPALLSAVLAFVIYLTNLQVPVVIQTTVQYIGNVATPVSMMLIGCILATVPVKKIFTVPSLYGLFAVKMVVLPLIAYGILSLLIADPVILGIVTIMFAMPVASNANMMAVVYGGDQQLASAGVFFSTLLSLGTIPAIMGLLFG